MIRVRKRMKRRRRRRRTLLWAIPKKTLIWVETQMPTSLALLKLLAFKPTVQVSFLLFFVNMPYYWH